MKTIRIIMFIATVLLFAACGKTKNKEADRRSEARKITIAEEQDRQDHTEENTVTLTGEQREAINLKLGDLTAVNLDGTIRVTGELELYPEDEATVGSFMDGNISRILVKPGKKVKKGQVLAYIEDPAFIDLQANLRELQSEYEYLSQEFDRQKKLYENKVASGKNYQRITSDYKSVTARLESTKAKLRLLRVNPNAIINGRTYDALPVVSPIKGYVREIGVTIGQRITTGSQLFRIMDKENIHADLLVYEKDLNKVKEGQKVTLYIANDRDRPVTGKITEIGKNYESTIRAVRMHASLEGDKEPFVPGMFVEGLIAVENMKTIALPELAVVEDEGKKYIFIKKESTGDIEEDKVKDAGQEKWAFTRMEIITGGTMEGWIEIKPLDTIPGKAEVVTEGAYYLLAEMKKGETEHSH
ncbi:efflux RND transporter periplasmic adaptor subunit [Sinomicrobium sp. M5D2P17]